MKLRFTSIKVWALFIAIPLAFLAVTKFASSMVQETSQEKRNWKVRKVGPKRMGIKAKELDTTIASEWIIEDQIPPRVPIDVEIKNLETDSLLRDIEIKVTNTAQKPIYFLELSIVLPDNLSPAGYPIGFSLRYGRDDLIKLDSTLEPSDVPLLSGASFILKIPQRNLTGFERLVAKGKITQAEVKRVYLMFRNLNFGDKTGFSSDGSAVPNIRKERSANDCYEKKPVDAARRPGPAWQCFPVSGKGQGHAWRSGRTVGLGRVSRRLGALKTLTGCKSIMSGPAVSALFSSVDVFGYSSLSHVPISLARL